MQCSLWVKIGLVGVITTHSICGTFWACSSIIHRIRRRGRWFSYLNVKIIGHFALCACVLEIPRYFSTEPLCGKAFYPVGAYLRNTLRWTPKKRKSLLLSSIFFVYQFHRFVPFLAWRARVSGHWKCNWLDSLHEKWLLRRDKFQKAK